MYYICIFLITGVFFYFYSKSIGASKGLLGLFIIILLMMLPSFQYNVGTDYFSYASIVEYPDNLWLYKTKGEYFFVLIVELINYYKLDYQYLFVFISIIQSMFILFILSEICNKKTKYNIVIFFYFFITITVLFHIQMNTLRSSIAIYSFLLAIILRFKNENKLSLVCFLFGLLWHKSILITIPLLIVPLSFWDIIYNNRVKIFAITFVFFISGIFVFARDYVLTEILTNYKHYLGGGYSKAAPFINIVTKMVYLPLYIGFFYTYRNDIVLDVFGRRVLSVFVLTSSLYLTLIYDGSIYRIYQYFIFFNLFPVYYLYIKQKLMGKVFIIVYLLIPYLFKVLIFPVSEFSYQSILF
ncbi:EpsG family protein [Photobacterium damselae]|uniref:EpsG family protein n=1 Tax=Photobacterium damselae TaxID=38293 RepID=UPI0011D0A368|nr:EpsG family protein [Photobacterium damselae subsp. damselae]